MNFYLIWDKTTERYVTTRKTVGRATANARIYATRNHALTAATLLAAPHWSAPADERLRARKERFEIHEYSADAYRVVG